VSHDKDSVEEKDEEYSPSEESEGDDFEEESVPERSTEEQDLTTFGLSTASNKNSGGDEPARAKASNRNATRSSWTGR